MYFFFIFGSIEVKGAAIATAISFVVGGIMMFVRYYNNQIFAFSKSGFHFYKTEFKECLTIGIPVVLERGVICLGHVTFASLIAKLGVVRFAAHTIAIQFAKTNNVIPQIIIKNIVIPLITYVTSLTLCSLFCPIALPTKVAAA